MYAAAAVTALVTGLKYIEPFSLGPIQGFGVIVAIGVLIGAWILRRYAEWHGVEDEYIRGLTGWITVAGFIGAHVFDVIAYQWHDLERDPILFIEIWKGISSYGGFIGGAIGFAIYVWWKRRPVRLFADIAIVGLLPAFTIGRIGCTVVSDHIGAAVDPSKWYAFIAMDYPRNLNETVRHIAMTAPGTGDFIRAWNLGLLEFLYLVPVNALILWLAFRTKKRPNAGFIPVLAGVFYAPVRFFLDFLRPEDTDPRYLWLTFAQWASIFAFGIACYVAVRIFTNGKPAETVGPSAGEVARRLKVILKGEDEKEEKNEKKDAPKAKAK